MSLQDGMFEMCIRDRPAGHESPSGTFEPQTGLRSKCHYLLRPLPVKKQSRKDVYKRQALVADDMVYVRNVGGELVALSLIHIAARSARGTRYTLG